MEKLLRGNILKLYDDDIWISLTDKYKSEFKLRLEE